MFINKIIIGVLLFSIFGVIFVFSLSAAAENKTATNIGAAPTLLEATTTAPELQVTPAQDGPLPGTGYNAGDVQKLFLSVDFFASSSENIIVDRLPVMLTNSIMSGFLNPALRGDNIKNITLVDETGKETAPASVVTDGTIVFSGLDLVVRPENAITLYFYADVDKNIVKEVSAKLELGGFGEIDARGADSGLAADISGVVPGNFFALSPAVPKPDLVAVGVELSQQNGQYDFLINEDTSVRVIYKNIGTGPGRRDFDKRVYSTDPDAFVFDNDGLPVLSDSLFALGQGELDPGSECVEIYSGHFEKASATTIKIEVDPSNTVDEINDHNNIFSYDILAAEDLSLPDFVVYDIKATPESPQVGQDTTIEVTYKNLGGDFGRGKGDFITETYFGYIEGWFIFNEAYPMETSRPYPTAANPLRTGEGLTEKFHGYFRHAKAMTLEAQIDPTNRVTETNENNNKLEKTIIVRAAGPSGLWGRLKGRIVLRVEENGEAYYLDPGAGSVNFLGRPADAFAVMRQQGVGIADANLKKIPAGLTADGAAVDTDGDGLPDTLEDALGTDPQAVDSDGDGLTDSEELDRGSDPTDGSCVCLITDYSFVEKSKGKIYLEVEKKGEAWYVNPADGRRYFLGRPADAFAVMRGLGLGISESDFNKL